MTDINSKRPSHRAYSVSKQNGKSFWREIGAVWSHEDGVGFTLKLELMPLDGSDIVIRKPRKKADKNAGEGGAR